MERNRFRIFLLSITFLFPLSSQSAMFQSYEFEAGLEVPVQIGVRVKGNFNDEFYGTAGLGLAMGFLLGINTSLSSGLGITGEYTANVIESALTDSIVLDFRLGWNLHNYNGLYLEAGGVYFTGGNGETDVETLEGAFGQEYHSNPNLLGPTSLVSISSDVFALSFHAGYRWEVSETMILSVDAGMLKPAFSSTSLTFDQVVPNTSSAGKVALALEEEVESSMDEVYLSEMFILSFSAWLAWEF